MRARFGPSAGNRQGWLEKAAVSRIAPQAIHQRVLVFKTRKVLESCTAVCRSCVRNRKCVLKLREVVSKSMALSRRLSVWKKFCASSHSQRNGDSGFWREKTLCVISEKTSF